jgi:hypothetical protein
MKRWGVIVVIALLGLSSCKRGNTSWRSLMRSANQATNIEKDKKDTSFTTSYGANVLSKTELPDSAGFKCYNVKIQLPKDTTNYLTFIKVGLPGMIGIEAVPHAKVKTELYLLNDTVNKYNSALWVFERGVQCLK